MTTSLNKILLVDTPGAGSHEATARAQTLAGSGGGEVTVLATVNGIPEAPNRGGVDLGKLIREEGHRRAEAIAAELKRSGVNASAKVRVGPSFIEIIKEAHELQADVVIKVSESMASKGSNIGTTDLHLLRKCPCPVWITRRRERAPYERIFAAVDPGDEGWGRDTELDAKILDYAARVARTDNAELTIVHAWQMIGEGMLRGRSRFSASEVQQMLDEERSTRESRIRDLASAGTLDGVDNSIRLIKGRPSEVIPQVVEQERADLLVMGTVVRTGIKGFFIGSTAEEVIQQVGCAILALKPAGFESPVLPPA